MFPRAKKSFGQNFLADPAVLRKIIAAAEITPGESVLEVGPGTGVLTEALVAAGARVTAVEADHDLIAPLREKFSDRITLIEGDILSLPPTSYHLPPPYKLIANIPYNITSDLLFHFLTAPEPPTRLVLMVQEEVADRITGKPPDMSLLSVVCQTYAKVAKVAKVPKGAFRPIPKVDSAIVRLDPYPIPKTQPPTPEAIISLAKIGFSHPRKQLHGNLAAAGVASSEQIKMILSGFGLPPTARAENVTAEQWREMAIRMLPTLASP